MNTPAPIASPAEGNGTSSVPSAAEPFTFGASHPDDPRPDLGQGPQCGDTDFDSRMRGSQPAGSYPFSGKSGAAPMQKDVVLSGDSPSTTTLPGTSPGEQDRPYAELTDFSSGFAQRLGTSTTGVNPQPMQNDIVQGPGAG